ncbi:HpcH/HpaI aldolase/citrate lyase family protein [Pseudonocardia kunmingensis]|uniref:Citrate lyase subunit beta/citryl-CoA lyase n=1 Tax=Pseudonocardia kunmingensis TaxID=630975 RepID=A0A543DY14_9PSEU|nr:CoA ester lyase [Pseudonocardia kunmingensis]TQM14230.1 citrate lyase subunit beta/citryl-CoA lyase [Pseudonocardia kunmingensis]
MLVGRTLLFVPGDRPERIGKAVATTADAVAVDLEDAVAPDAKARAREAVPGAVAATPPRAGLFLRVNALDTPHFADDMATVAALLPRLAGVLLPKVEDARAVQRLDELLTGLEAAAGRPVGATAVLPIVETARGVLAAPAVAAAGPRVATLLFGTLDLASDLGVTPTVDGRELLHARSQVVLATAAAGLPGPLDGPHAALDDADGLVRASVLARELGFTGKVVLHPRQLAPVQEAFSPTAAELARAREVVAAAREAGSGAFRLADGTFVDAPVLRRATALLGVQE